MSDYQRSQPELPKSSLGFDFQKQISDRNVEHAMFLSVKKTSAFGWTRSSRAFDLINRRVAECRRHVTRCGIEFTQLVPLYFNNFQL